MKLGFVSAILPDYTLEQVLSFAQRGGLFERRADVLAARQVRAPVCRRDAPRRRPTCRPARSRRSRTCWRSTRSRSRGWAIIPTRLSADRAEAEVAVTRTCAR